LPDLDLRILAPADRGRLVTILVDGEPLDAYEGESIAAAFLAAGHRTTRWTARTGEPRGYFCGMGVCHDCLVEVDGEPSVRACLTPVRAGLRVARQRGVGARAAPG
jgi:predicted molibdopterin-dependent oxidoreductase YjgC